MILLDREFKKRDKKVQKLTKDGMVERNVATGDERRISQREQGYDLRGGSTGDSGIPRQAEQAARSGGSVRREIAETTGRSRSGRGQRQTTQDAEHATDARRNNSGGVYDNRPEYTQSATHQLQSSESPTHYAPGDSAFPDNNRTESKQPSTRQSVSSVRREPARSTVPDSSSKPRRGGRGVTAHDRHRYDNTVPPVLPLPDEDSSVSQRFAEEVVTQSRRPVPPTDGADARQAQQSAEQKPAASERRGRLRFEDSDSATVSDTKPKQSGTAYQRKFVEDTSSDDGVDSPDDSSANDTAGSQAQSDSADQQNSADASQSADTDSSSGEGSSDDTPPPADDPILSRKPKDSKAGGKPPSDGSSPDPPPPKKSKLEFDKEEQSAGSSADKKSARKVDKARSKAEKATGKLEKAREKLPTKKKAHFDKVLDEKSGKMKRKLHFETVTKTQREHIKGPLITRPVKFGANAAILNAHRKIYQVEDENVAVKAAHRGEMAVESGLRIAHRRHKTKPYRRVRKLQKRATKRAANHAYQKALHDNPKLRSNVFSRMMQKRKIKKEYAKAARGVGRGGFAFVKKTAIATGKAVKAVVMTVVRHPAVFGIIALILLLLFMVAGFFVSCANMASGGLSTIISSSYLAEDADIDDAGIAYSEWETDLRLEIENAETNHSGYDEYRYDIGDIGHDPFELMAFLTAVYQDFTMSEIEAILAEIFAEQYNLTFTPEVEIRTRTETRTGTGTNPDGSTYTYTYTVEVEYEWHILNVSLVTKPFSEVIESRMNADQREIFDVLMETKGNRQYLISPFAFNWLPNISSHYGWRIHPISGVREFHAGIDIAVPEGTEILAGQDGVITFAGSNGDYGLFVVIEGANGLSSRYAHCSSILVTIGQEVKRGDPIALVGSTGASTGPHLHLEVILNGRFLNPAFFTSF